MSSIMESREQEGRPGTVQTVGSSTLLLASGVSIGFLVGWILRGSSPSQHISRISRTVRSVAGYAAKHGKISRTKLVLVARTDLEMGKGKLAAQCGHAAVGAVQNFKGKDELLNLWLNTGQPKVVVRVANEDELLKIARHGDELGLSTFVVRDAGKTQLEPGTTTVLAVGPHEVEQVDKATGSLRLFS